MAACPSCGKDNEADARFCSDKCRQRVFRRMAVRKQFESVREMVADDQAGHRQCVQPELGLDAEMVREDQAVELGMMAETSFFLPVDGAQYLLEIGPGGYPLFGAVPPTKATS